MTDNSSPGPEESRRETGDSRISSGATKTPAQLRSPARNSRAGPQSTVHRLTTTISIYRRRENNNISIHVHVTSALTRQICFVAFVTPVVSAGSQDIVIGKLHK